MIAEIRNRILAEIRISEEPPTKIAVMRSMSDIGAKTVFKEINEMLDEGILELTDVGYSTKGLKITENGHL